MAPHEQIPCLTTLPPPTHPFAHTLPQGSPGQKEVLEKDPVGPWAPRGLPEETQPQPSQQVLPPGGSRDGHTAPGELHGRECPGWPRRTEVLPGVLDSGPGLPGRISEAQGMQENSQALAGSVVHSSSVHALVPLSLGERG